MGYNLYINGVYWGYNPLTNLLLTSWDIQVNPSLPVLTIHMCSKRTCIYHVCSPPMPGKTKTRRVQGTLCAVLTCGFQWSVHPGYLRCLGGEILQERGTTGVRKKQFTTSAKAMHTDAAFSYADVISLIWNHLQITKPPSPKNRTRHPVSAVFHL